MNVLMIHGVNTNEDAVPSPYIAWSAAITAGLKGSGYGDPIAADPVNDGVRFNDIFVNHSDNPAVYAAAVAELVATWTWHSVFGQLAVQPQMAVPADQQPSDGVLSAVRWTAGMVAQWVVEDSLRSDCCDRLFSLMQQVKPDVIFAHSLGSLLCYDFLANDVRGQKLFKGGTLVTFGSQIGNSFVVDNRWKKAQVGMLNVKNWYNIYNPYDHVFVSPISLASPNYHQFIVNPPFGSGGAFDFDGHQAVKGGGTNSNPYPGYLDNATTNANLWPALAGGTMANLIAANVRTMKHTPPKRTVATIK